jgi:hypothetical protein
MKELREYQLNGATLGVDILNKYGILYMAWGVRTGKTCTSLKVCHLFGAKNVLFLTKKKAISSVQSDYEEFGFDKLFNVVICNNESMHKLPHTDYDVVVMDENHRHGSFPKPSSGAKLFKSMFGDKPIIMLSGTPTPESFSQMYHQMWVSYKSPWTRYQNFYKWSRDYVDVRQKRIGAFAHNDYTAGIESKIMGDISHLMITYTQEQAGFKSVITESVLYVKMKPVIYTMVNTLQKDLVIQGKSEVVLGDTAAKLMQKMHQLYSGTVKFESGRSMVIDTTKAEFIKSHFTGSKIGIFYVFKEELNALMQVFGADNLTTDLDEFNSTDKNIALQVVSGREGISLRNADFLVFYNIQHSAVSFWQARDRMTTMDRPDNQVFWIFSEGGIEDKIYKVVKSKKRYTTNIFKKDYGIK